jgi:succinate-acetate transporter protein
MEESEMKYTKRLAVIILLLALCFTLAACGRASNSQVQTPAAAQSGSSLTVDRFENLAQGVTVESMPWYRGAVNVYSTPQGGITKRTPVGTLVYGGNSSIS